MNSFEIENALKKGVNRGKKARKRTRVININIISVIAIFLAFSISVNISGTFASSISGIPVIGKIADFVRIGSGFTEVAERGFFSQGETIISDENYKISIEGYYFSDKNLNIIIRVDGKFNEDYIYEISNVDLLKEDGSKMSGGFLSYGCLDLTDGYGIASIVANQVEENFPEELTLCFDFAYTSYNKTQREATILYENLKVPLKRQMIEENIKITIEETVEVEDIQMDIISLSITPTIMELVIKVESEKMVFYGFDSLYF